MAAIGAGRVLFRGLHLGYCAQRCPRAQRRDSPGSEASPGLLLGRGWGAPWMREGWGSWVGLAWRREGRGGRGAVWLLPSTTSRGWQRGWSQTILMSAWEEGQVADCDCCLSEILGTCLYFISLPPPHYEMGLSHGNWTLGDYGVSILRHCFVF